MTLFKDGISWILTTFIENVRISFSIRPFHRRFMETGITGTASTTYGNLGREERRSGYAFNYNHLHSIKIFFILHYRRGTCLQE